MKSGLHMATGAYRVTAIIAALCGSVCAVSVGAADSIDSALSASARQVKVTNGQVVEEGQYPFLTAVVSGRAASMNLGAESVNVRYFGAAIQREFHGELVGCGFAVGPCRAVSGKVCAIILDFPLSDTPALSPARQLRNCSDAGGIAAVFRPNTRNYVERLDLNDLRPLIPAVYVHDDEGYQGLQTALSGESATVSVTDVIPDTIHCGGTYIGGRWVLTAAHCVIDETSYGSRIVEPKELLVNAGAHDLSFGKEFVQTVTKIVVGDYRRKGAFGIDDFALLQLDSVPARARPLNLVSADILDSLAAEAAPALVLGWGRTQVRQPLTPVDPTGVTSDFPRSALLRLEANDSCQISWDTFAASRPLGFSGLQLEDSHICASYPKFQRDTCQGDSGGPLVVNVNGELQLAGITSFGLGCGSAESVPAVYARIPAFSQWIYNNTGLSASDSSNPGFVVESKSFLSQQSGAGGFGLSLFALAGMVMMLKRRIKPAVAGAAALLIASGCSADSVEQNTGEAVLQAAIGTLENIDASVVNDKLIEATVIGNGCTEAAHFEVASRIDQTCALTIYRKQPDLCKRAPQAVSLQIAWTLPTACSSRQLVFDNPRLTDD